MAKGFVVRWVLYKPELYVIGCSLTRNDYPILERFPLLLGVFGGNKLVLSTYRKLAVF